MHRQVNPFFALLIVTIFAAAGALLILNKATSVVYAPSAEIDF